MRPVRRSRTIACDGDRLWSFVSDPTKLPRWWPSVSRVEDATPTAWTKVLETGRGRAVRADFTRIGYEYGHKLTWRQEIEGSPFERVFESSLTDVVLEPAGPGRTSVELRSTEELRGGFKPGGFIVRRAARRRLDAALDGLEQALAAT